MLIADFYGVMDNKTLDYLRYIKSISVYYKLNSNAANRLKAQSPQNHKIHPQNKLKKLTKL